LRHDDFLEEGLTMKGLLLAAALGALAVSAAHAAAPAIDGKKVAACMDAADDAGKFAGNCIGMIFADCNKAPNADINACGAKELAFWQGQLDATLKRARKDLAHADEAKDQSDAHKAWLTFRDKACAIADTVDPGTMPGGSAYCRAEVTAERVFMLRRITYSLEEH
jgi:uncharacterized protein YecT (DUF1311 family)